MTRQPTPGVYENYRDLGEFGEGATVRRANEVSSLASLLLDAATKLDRVNRAATRSASATTVGNIKLGSNSVDDREDRNAVVNSAADQSGTSHE